MRPKIIIILGPTASGKTALAIKLAKKFNGEIVSADSRQVYRGMDIGTAKPTGKELKQIKHYLIDIKNPDQPYTLGQFKQDAVKTVRKINKTGKVPFLVGGTGLYIKAVVENLNIPEVKPNKQLRRKLERQLVKHGLPYLYGKLTALDPETAYIIDPKNPRRIIRALEVAMTTKKPFSQQRKKGQPLFDCLILGLDPSPAKLKSKIFKRSEIMISQGLAEEVKKLVEKYGARQIPFDAIGYREIIHYLRGKTTLRQALELINKNTWQFAKRQLTWFRHLPIVWTKNQTEAEKEIEKFLK